MKNYKVRRKLITFICDFCGEEDTKPVTEFNRNKALNRKNFCSRSCSVKYSNKYIVKSTSNRYDISQHAGNQKTELSPFNYLYRSAKRRFKEFNISLNDMKTQWELQNGICPYSGFTLELPLGIKKLHHSTRASLDRIDSSKGYIVGNIQFVSTLINFMKSDLSEDEIIDFRDKIVKNFCKCA